MSAHTRFAFKLLALAACASAACAAAAQAADNTRYVSIAGSNANACTLAAPCRTLRRGINLTPVGGEVRILDSGDYGNNVTVNRSMTISGNGNTVYLGSPIVIDKAGAVVALRGLVLNGQGTIADGISIDAAAAVHIERCVIHGYTDDGIRANPSATGVEMSVSDSISRGNGLNGIFVGAGGLRLTIDNSRFESNGFDGARIFSGGHAAIYRSTASGNNNNGIFVGGISVSVMSTIVVQNGQSGFALSNGGSLTAEALLANGNGGNGLGVQAGSVARISNSTFTNNATGILNNSGVVETRQNNTVRGNTTNVSGALTVIGGI